MLRRKRNPMVRFLSPSGSNASAQAHTRALRPSLNLVTYATSFLFPPAEEPPKDQPDLAPTPGSSQPMATPIFLALFSPAISCLKLSYQNRRMSVPQCTKRANPNQALSVALWETFRADHELCLLVLCFKPDYYCHHNIVLYTGERKTWIETSQRKAIAMQTVRSVGRHVNALARRRQVASLHTFANTLHLILK